MKIAASALCGAASAAVMLAGTATSVGVAAQPRFARVGHAEVLDDRYHHGHYYLPRGVAVRELPVGYRPYWFHGSPFYFAAGGVWYAPGPGGFVVVRPPAGLIVTALPAFYTTLWIAGMPYYYANDVYYRWSPEANGYEVVAPPQGADAPGEAPAQSASGHDLILYPKNGQNMQQQSADRYECHSWSKAQSGFDPTQPGGVAPQDSNAKRDQYQRAMSACLEARGYSVK